MRGETEKMRFLSSFSSFLLLLLFFRRSVSAIDNKEYLRFTRDREGHLNIEMESMLNVVSIFQNKVQELEKMGFERWRKRWIESNLKSVCSSSTRLINDFYALCSVKSSQLNIQNSQSKNISPSL